MKKLFRSIGKFFQFIFGLAFIVWGIISLTANTSSFRTVEAEVLSSSIKIYSGDDTSETHEIQYQYHVDGVTYTGSYTSAVDRAAGDKVTVYYDPASPSQSYYSQRQPITWGLTSLVFGLFAAGDVIWDAWKRRAVKKDSATVPGQDPQ